MIFNKLVPSIPPPNTEIIIILLTSVYIIFKDKKY